MWVQLSAVERRIYSNWCYMTRQTEKKCCVRAHNDQNALRRPGPAAAWRTERQETWQPSPNQLDTKLRRVPENIWGNRILIDIWSEPLSSIRLCQIDSGRSFSNRNCSEPGRGTSCSQNRLQSSVSSCCCLFSISVCLCLSKYNIQPSLCSGCWWLSW